MDIEAGDRAVELMKAAVSRTHGPEVLGGVGGFGGVFDASALLTYRRPLLVTSTDGVGTKVALAQALDRHDTIGQDLVGMVVDDIVVCGAKPLFMTDYIATGRVVPERIAAVVGGIAAACEAAGVALVGGETAEHPGLLGPDEYDVAGAATGVVEADRLLGPDRVRAGDVILGLASSGLHSNGYSLARYIVAGAGWSWEREVPEFGTTLGDALLTPTQVYTPAALAAAALEDANGPLVHAFSHITGGGIASNVARVLPPTLVANIDRSSWDVPAVFTVLSALGSVPRADLEATFNLGIGMVAIVRGDAAELVTAELERHGERVVVIGTVGLDVAVGEGTRVSGTKGVRGGAAVLSGEYRMR